MNEHTPVRDILALIRARMDRLGAAEKRIADYIIKNPQGITGMGVATIATAASVSQPTVVRFCRKLGFSGYTDFKVRYAQGLVLHENLMHQDISRNDDTQTVIRKVFDSFVVALSGVRDGLDPQQIDAAANLIAQARCVECYGNGAAHVVAVEARDKFYRLGIPSSVTPDYFTQVVTSGILGPRDVILGVSFNGRSRPLLDVVGLAQQSGASVVALTEPGSPLAREATVSIDIVAGEDFVSYTPMSTPATYMAVVDILAMAISLRQSPEVGERHARGKRAIERLAKLKS
ncbi:MAG: MurR/RpiR family transcriptional regulator [Rhodospirillales bacterium]|jgi:RpiR family transcriptional regulator, carbohydrate utilization regulator|nr:MurR/RpiR family transcriptional regulator [Rhodospirillales bacterium]